MPGLAALISIPVGILTACALLLLHHVAGGYEGLEESLGLKVALFGSSALIAFGISLWDSVILLMFGLSLSVTLPVFVWIMLGGVPHDGSPLTVAIWFLFAFGAMVVVPTLAAELWLGSPRVLRPPGWAPIIAGTVLSLGAHGIPDRKWKRMPTRLQKP